MPKTAPGVDAAKVVITGATQLRTAFAAGQVPGIIRAYMGGIKLALAIPIAGNGIAFVLSVCIWLSNWRKLELGTKKESTNVV